MQVKIPNEMDEQGPTSSNQKFDKSCTSSVYISQPSTATPVSTSNDHVTNETSNNNDHTAQNHNRAIDVVTTGGEAPRQSKPVLTIQVNQNTNPTVVNQSSSNLVNIVSCFRAYPNANVSTMSSISTGNEKSVQNHEKNSNVNAAPFSVSVNRNNDDFIATSSVSGGESVNNENNQNIINIDASLKNNHNVANEKQAQSNSTVKREVDLNEICVENNLSNVNVGNTPSDTNASSCNSKSNNVDYIRNSSSSLTTLEIIANGLSSSTSTTNINSANDENGNEIEKKMVIGDSGTAKNDDGGDESMGINIANVQLHVQPQHHHDNVINHSATIETIVVDVESKENENSKNDNVNCSMKSENQSHREQRRRERRERRQARQRAQHGHHHITTAPIHQHHQRANVANANALANGIRTFNGVEPSRTGNFDILPDIVNHQPPPYTSLPLQLPSPSTIHTISPISPVPVVVDDCRFSFPIPIIRR